MASRKAIDLVKKASTETLLLRCHVRPGASRVREGVTEVTDEAVELCVAAQAQDGKANKAVVEILSETLGVPKSDLQIMQGSKSRDKTVGVSTVGLRAKSSRAPRQQGQGQGQGQGQAGDKELVASIRELLLRGV